MATNVSERGLRFSWGEPAAGHCCLHGDRDRERRGSVAWRWALRRAPPARCLCSAAGEFVHDWRHSSVTAAGGRPARSGSATPVPAADTCGAVLRGGLARPSRCPREAAEAPKSSPVPDGCLQKCPSRGPGCFPAITSRSSSSPGQRFLCCLPWVLLVYLRLPLRSDSSANGSVFSRQPRLPCR